MLIYGARASPLSYFLSRTLNLRCHASNVFVVDSAASRAANKLPATRDKFTCQLLDDVAEGAEVELTVIDVVKVAIVALN